MTAMKKNECKECRAWQEAMAALIESLPQPTKSHVCAKLAKIPSIWTGLTTIKGKAQVRSILSKLNMK